MPGFRTTRAVRAAAAALLVAATLTACGSGSAPAMDNPYGLVQPSTITAAVSTDQPPFASAGTGGQPQGFIVDLTDALAKRLGLKVVYKATTVTAALQGLTAGQYDLAASGLGVTADRQRQVSFTDDLFWSTTALLTKVGAPTRLSGYVGKHVGVVTGAVQQEFIKDQMSGAVETDFAGETAAVTQLLSGDLDAFVVGGPDAERYVKQYPGLAISYSAPVDHPTAMAVPKPDTALLKAIDTQLAAMVADGTFLKIYRTWFTEPPQPQLLAVWPALATQVAAK